MPMTDRPVPRQSRGLDIALLPALMVAPRAVL
jgi:hypothetical protein